MESSPDADLAHAASLKRLAAVLADPQGADDLVQSTWVRALEQGAVEVRSRGAWLRQVLRNEHRMELRSRRRAQAREQAVIVDNGDDVERDAAQRQVACIVAQLVEGLEPEVREVVQQRYYDGHSAADIARARKIPAGTVRWRLKLGLDRLREQLDARYGGRRAMWAGAFAPLAFPPTIGDAAASLGSKNVATAASSQGKSAMIVKLVIGCVVAATAGGVIALNVDERGEPEVAGEGQGVATPVTANAKSARTRPDREAVDLAHRRWTQRKEDIRAAHAQRRVLAASETSQADDEDCGSTCTDDACLMRLATQVTELVNGCEELASGVPTSTSLRAHIIGAPDVGTIVESVELTGDNALPSELGECLTESMYMLELEAEKGNFSQEITVSLQTQANDDDRVARIAKDGELVEVDAADVASLLVGAGIEEPPADSRIYVMGSSAPE